MTKRVFQRIILLIFPLFLLVAAPVMAQDDAEDDITIIQYGEVVTGRISNSEPTATFYINALRCDFISLSVTTTGGNLDPVVTVLDASGTPIFQRDDTDGGVDVNFSPLEMPRSGRYAIVVGRFGYGLGTTTGSFELLVERIGNGSNPNCAMRYGDTVFFAVTNETPEIVYSFRARQGDIIDVLMERRSGDLDPYLSLASDQGVVLAFNDDVSAAPVDKDAGILQFVVPETGTYFLVATRYGFNAGPSSGNFSLMLDEAANSGLGNSALAALAISAGDTVDGEITGTQIARYYRFQAQQNDLVTVNMTRLNGNLDALVVIANASLQELAINDDANSGTQNSRINQFLIPANGTYYVIATRFERELGSTTGTYRLELETSASPFEQVQGDVRQIQYGTSISGTLDDATPDVRYAFFGQAGELVRVTMERSGGDLDPFIEILAGDGSTVLFSDDDGGEGQNARVDRFQLPQTGLYYIRATRYSGEDNPNTAGDFILVVAEIFE